jgi:hypothetical protein
VSSPYRVRGEYREVFAFASFWVGTCRLRCHRSCRRDRTPPSGTGSWSIHRRVSAVDRLVQGLEDLCPLDADPLLPASVILTAWKSSLSLGSTEICSPSTNSSSTPAGWANATDARVRAGNVRRCSCAGRWCTGSGDGVWDRLQDRVSRERSAAAVAIEEELAVDLDDDVGAGQRQEWVKRYAMIRPFLPKLAAVIPMKAIDVGCPILPSADWMMWLAVNGYAAATSSKVW